MNRLSERWYEMEGDAIAVELWSVMRRIWGKTGWRRSVDSWLSSMVDDTAYCGGGASQTIADRKMLGENKVKQVASTMLSKLSKHRTQPVVLCDMADFESQHRGRTMGRMIWGAVVESGGHAAQRLSDLHGITYGTGALWVGSVDGRIAVEHVPTWELHVDPSDGRYGTPRSIYRLRAVPRSVLLRRYPEHSDRIQIAEIAPLAMQSQLGVGGHRDGSDTDDMVLCLEGWHLPSADGAKDGMYCITVDGTTLASEPWDRKRFPFAFWRFELRLQGFWGSGIVEQLAPLQHEYSRAYITRVETMARMANSFVLLQQGSGIVEEHLVSDAIGRVISYTGAKPEFVNPPVFSRDLAEHSDRVGDAIMAQSGTSQLATQSLKPAGLQSGAALNAYADLESERFAASLIRREEQMVQVGELILDELESGACGDIVYAGILGIETIKWADLKADRDSFRLQCSPASSLPKTLGGKLQAVQGLQDVGYPLSPEALLSLMDVPDLTALREREGSMRDLLSRVLETRILRDGHAVPPEPTWDLAMCLEVGMQVMLRAQLANAPEDRIDLLRRFLVEAQALVPAPEPEPGPPPVDMGGAPPGLPAAPEGGPV